MNNAPQCAGNDKNTSTETLMPHEANGAIVLKSVHGYHVGGKRVTLSGLPSRNVQHVPGGPVFNSDPNGDHQVGQLYVQRFALTAPRAEYPLLLWHGGGLTGVTWETTPDGRSGWHEFFMRAGHDTYVSDAVERGRASWARYPQINPGEPEHRTINQAWGTFRFGPEGGYDSVPERRQFFVGQRFPEIAIDQFAKQFVPRWTTSNTWVQTAYDELVQTTGPCVILAHSQGGVFGLNSAQFAPDIVKAVILIEPGAAPDPLQLDLKRVRHIPHLIVWGDYIKESPLWLSYRANVETYTNALKIAGGSVDTIDLPSLSIRGNTHMLMMDDNSDEIAAIINAWMIRNGLFRQAAMHLS
jgi:pimeloyl-ACP methyl ester carboxylesterase